MKGICIYGKGGIGKSTVASNVAAALGKEGMKILLMGCDPKADSVRTVMGKRIPAVLEVFRSKNGMVAERDVLFEGFAGVHCIETGGPRPGEGCAGRGIVTAVQILHQLDIIRRHGYDAVIYDVLGDVVCGGFSLPIKECLAENVYIVTTCDYMSLYAANNICHCIAKFSRTGRARLGGIIHNGRSVVDAPGVVQEFSASLGTEVVGHLPMDSRITMAELNGRTVVEHEPASDAARCFGQLGRRLLEQSAGVVPEVLTDSALESFARKIEAGIREGKRNAQTSLL